MIQHRVRLLLAHLAPYHDPTKPNLRREKPHAPRGQIERRGEGSGAGGVAGVCKLNGRESTAHQRRAWRDGTDRDPRRLGLVRQERQTRGGTAGRERNDAFETTQGPAPSI